MPDLIEKNPDIPLRYNTFVVDSSTMTSVQSQFDRLVDRLEKFTEALSRSGGLGQPEEGNVPSPSRGKGFNWGILTTLISFALFVAASVWVLHAELSKINDRMGMIDKRMARLETAIRILSDAQDNKTKELVHDALTVAQMKVDSGNLESASRALAIANQLIAQEKVLKATANHEFFQDTLEHYRKLYSVSHGNEPLAAEVFNGRIQLAEYRSALTVPPPDFHPQHEYRGVGDTFIGKMTIEKGHVLLRDAILYGNSIGGPEGGFAIDGFELDNVVLNGVTIRYHGGPLILRNVWFVNCTFIVRQSQSGDQFLEVAALAEPSANIG
jgi:hypothetical protein